MPVSPYYWMTFANGSRQMRDLWGEMVVSIENRRFAKVPEIWVQIHELADVLTVTLEKIRKEEREKPS